MIITCLALLTAGITIMATNNQFLNRTYIKNLIGLGFASLGLFFFYEEISKSNSFSQSTLIEKAETEFLGMKLGQNVSNVDKSQFAHFDPECGEAQNGNCFLVKIDGFPKHFHGNYELNEADEVNKISLHCDYWQWRMDLKQEVPTSFFSLRGIECGDSVKKIFQKFQKEDIHVKCPHDEKSVLISEYKNYYIPKFNLRFSATEGVIDWLAVINWNDRGDEKYLWVDCEG